MRDKYESLPLSTLKDLARARGLKGISTMKKAELIERMLEEDEKDKQASREQVKEMSANTGDKEVHDIGLRRTGFWRCFPMGTDLSEAPIICQERMTYMCPHPRFVSLI